MQRAERSPADDSPNWHRHLFSVLNSGIAVYRAVDGGDNFVFADLNPAAELIEQVSRAEVLGRRVTEVFPGVVDFGLLEVLRRVSRRGIAEAHPLSLYSDGRISGWRANRVFRLPKGEVVALYDDYGPQITIEESGARQTMLAAELSYRVDNRLAPRELHPAQEKGRSEPPADAPSADSEGAMRQSFSARQAEVMRLVAAGNCNKRIAGLLGINVRTVEQHRAAALRKAGVRTTAEFVRFAIKHKLIRD